jgi:putative flippase GtrA
LISFGRRLRLMRGLKFSAVGAAGLAVQLAMLWALTRGSFPVWLATALAVETAVLHNFVWHEVWTWPASRGGVQSTRLGRLWRFHAATGVISIVFNTVLTVLFKSWLPIPLLVANVMAVAATAILNFLAADLWVFAR